MPLTLDDTSNPEKWVWIGRLSDGGFLIRNEIGVAKEIDDLACGRSSAG